MSKKTEIHEYNLDKLKEEFPDHELKWRPLVGGIGANGKPWLQVSCYAGRESYENRLDEVFGPLNWYTDYILLGDGRVICHLFIRCGDGWLKKYGPGEESNVDQGKFMSGHTGSFKKACACGLGIGRYIGEEEVYFAECNVNFSKEFPNKFYQKKNNKEVKFWWKYPKRSKKNEYTIQGPEDSELQTNTQSKTQERQQQTQTITQQNFGRK